MATFTDVLTEFQARLNRDDCSDQLAAYFVAEATRQIQRDVHLPSMERLEQILPQGPVTFVSVPQDLLELIDIFATPFAASSYSPAVPVALDRVSYRELAGRSTLVGPSAYARLNTTYQIRGAVPAGGEIQIQYYGRATPLVNATDSNELTQACPDLLIYGALMFAGDHFEHPNATAWATRYSALLTSIQADQIRLDSTGGSAVIRSPYEWTA